MSMPIPKELRQKLRALDCAEELPFRPTATPARPRAVESLQILDLDTVVHRHIHLVLDLNRGNKVKTARQLGISRSTLYRILDGESAPVS